MIKSLNIQFWVAIVVKDMTVLSIMAFPFQNKNKFLFFNFICFALEWSVSTLLDETRHVIALRVSLNGQSQNI